MTAPPLTRKSTRPIVDSNASKEIDISELLNRGAQLLLELDRQAEQLHDGIKLAL